MYFKLSFNAGFSFTSTAQEAAPAAAAAEVTQLLLKVGIL
jgi:hypothetical protein